jgi:hypothetical protein
MKKIWKYRLSFPITKVSMPSDALILSVQLQGGLPTLWSLCNPDAAYETRQIEIYGTGQDIPEGRIYIGTFQIDDLRVFHAFDKFEG